MVNTNCQQPSDKPLLVRCCELLDLISLAPLALMIFFAKINLYMYCIYRVQVAASKVLGMQFTTFLKILVEKERVSIKFPTL